MSSRDSEHYEDTHDMIERIRKLKDAAQRKMDAFGDPSGYDVRVIQGRKTAAAVASDEPTEEVSQ